MYAKGENGGGAARALDVLTNLEPQADIHTENKRREKLIDIITPKRERRKKKYICRVH